jgi:hypothetical protein
MIYPLINYRKIRRLCISNTGGKALLSPSVACLVARKRTDRSGGGTLRMRCALAAPPDWRRNNAPSCLQIRAFVQFLETVPIRLSDSCQLSLEFGRNINPKTSVPVRSYLYGSGIFQQKAIKFRKALFSNLVSFLMTCYL